MKTVFIDSNIWIYAHVKADDEVKRGKALSLVEDAVRKYNVKKDIIARKVQSIAKIAYIAPLTITTYLTALKLRRTMIFRFGTVCSLQVPLKMMRKFFLEKICSTDLLLRNCLQFRIHLSLHDYITIRGST